MPKTVEFLINFEQFNGRKLVPIDGTPQFVGDIATFPDEKADKLLRMRVKMPNGMEQPVVQLVPEEKMREFYRIEKERVERDRPELFDGPNLKEKLKPSHFARLHPELARKFDAEKPQQTPART